MSGTVSIQRLVQQFWKYFAKIEVLHRNLPRHPTMTRIVRLQGIQRDRRLLRTGKRQESRIRWQPLREPRVLRDYRPATGQIRQTAFTEPSAVADDISM